MGVIRQVGTVGRMRSGFAGRPLAASRLLGRFDMGRLLRFAVTGLLAAALQLLILRALLEAAVQPHLANVCAFTLSAQANFGLSRWFIWGDRTRIRPGHAWLAFMVSNAGTAVLNLSVFAIASFEIGTLEAAALGIAAAAGVNFLVGDRFVFRGEAARGHVSTQE